MEYEMNEINFLISLAWAEGGIHTDIQNRRGRSNAKDREVL